MNGHSFIDTTVFEFSEGDVKAAMLMSLLTVWVLVALFTYLNRYTRRAYFSIWTAGWLFYALWLTLGLVTANASALPWIEFARDCCISASAVLLLWGGLRALGLPLPQRPVALLIVFTVVWGATVRHYAEGPLLVSGPVFALLGLSSGINAVCFFRLRQRLRYLGAGLLGGGFALWGLYLAAYPFIAYLGEWAAAAFFSAGVLQLFIAISMIILVLEEARAKREEAVSEARSHRTEAEHLRFDVASTEERYRQLFDNASEGIVIAAADDLRILELNHAARELLELVEASPPLPRFFRFFEKSLAAGPGEFRSPATGTEWTVEIVSRPEHALIRRDGSSLPVEVTGAPIRFDRQAAYQFFIRELTARARLEQQLRQAEKLSALGRMISGVAHELNNPLAVIKGYTDLILQKHPLSAATREDLQKVAHESDRAARLVAKFLSLARADAAARKSVPLNALAARVVERNTLEAARRGIDLEFQPGTEDPVIEANADQIEQLLVILLKNSFQAVSPATSAGRVVVRAATNSGPVHLIVEDNGPGVPEHLQSKIFEPFFTTKDVGAGTGLGLSIAHSIATEHEGKIRYRRSALGGACFDIEFPARPVAAVAPEEETVIVPCPPTRPVVPEARVLIVDDEQALAELLGEMLELHGYTVTVCCDPKDALQRLDASPYDLMISDFRMPGMDGRQLYQSAIARRPELARRFIFLTGDVVTPETKSFLESTGNPHLAKPFQIQKVEAAIAHLLAETAQAA